MRLGYTDLGVGALARFASKLERDDSGYVSLQRQYLQVEHQLGVIAVGNWNAYRPVQIRQVGFGGVTFCLLNAPLNFANGVQIVADDDTVACAEFALQARHIFVHPIEQTGPAAQSL